MVIFFWISVCILFYTYLGYGLLLLLVSLLRRPRRKVDEAFLPEVTFVVPAYNEVAILSAKIENSLALDYPAHKIKWLFVTDGSTDGSDAIVKRYTALQHLHLPQRRGKAAALNRAMQTVTTPIVIFSDANTFLHPGSVRQLVKNYADERVGGISGEKRVANPVASAVGFGERLYWRYESLLKKANSDFYTIVGAAGELFSIRTHLFQPVEEDTILDDFVISARICLAGYRFLYEEGAVATESSSASISEERKRKIRISAGCYQALVRCTALLNPFGSVRLAFQYLSYRVLRWTVCPLLLPLVLLANLLLVVRGAGWMYNVFMGVQLLMYLMAALGKLLVQRAGTPGFFLVPYYFLFMIGSQYVGFIRFIGKKQSVLWERSRREQAVPIH